MNAFSVNIQTVLTCLGKRLWSVFLPGWRLYFLLSFTNATIPSYQVICVNEDFPLIWQVVYNKSNLTSMVPGCCFTLNDPLVVWEGYQGSRHLLYEQFYHFDCWVLHRVGPPFVELLLSSPDPCNAQLCPSWSLFCVALNRDSMWRKRDIRKVFRSQYFSGKAYLSVHKLCFESVTSLLGTG